MANPDHEKELKNPEVRTLFDLENFLKVIGTERTQSQCKVDIKLWKNIMRILLILSLIQSMMARTVTLILKKNWRVEEKLKTAKDPNYSATLIGTIGVEPSVV